jgi:hypothetical protein
MGRRPSRGKWGSGYTAVAISRFMGTTVHSAKKHLYELRDFLGRMPTDDEIGQLIQGYRNRKDYAKIKKILG